MELKPGYQQTEVGVIPVGWNQKNIGGFVTLKRGHDLTWRDRCDGDIPIMGSAGPNGFHNTALAKGPGVVLGRSGASFGQAHYCELDFWPHNTALYVTDFKGNHPLFVYYLFSSIDFSSHNSGGAQQSLNRNFIAPIGIGVPAPEEQRRLANALSDVDELIGALEELISKKRNIKQAAMQELLTGKRRLPGFEGEWEVKRLGSSIRDLDAGVSVRSSTDRDQPSNGYYILKTSSVSQGRFLPTECKEISSADISRAKTPIKKGDLIISRMNTPALVGECGYSHSDHPFLFLPDRLWRAAYRDPHAVSSRWLSYTLSTQQNRARIKELATGTSGSMKNISKRTLLDLEIKWPNLDEQIAIAEVLSEMDADIGSINEHFQKAQGIKQGMMQQLLTGKIRLR